MSEWLATMWMAFFDVITVSGSRLGFMIVAAILLGFMFNQNLRSVKTWFFIGAVYIGFQEWMRIAVLLSLRPTDPLTMRPLILSLIAAPLFGLSVAAGIKLGNVYQQRLQLSLTAEKNILEVIKKDLTEKNCKSIG